MPGELRAVLWDMDGTLIDSEPIWIGAQRHLVSQFGAIWTEANGLTLVGAGMGETVAAMQGAGVDIEPALILALLEQAVAEELGREIIWRTGVTPLVSALHSVGIPQAIVTTSPRRLVNLVAAGLSSHGTISVIVAGDDVSRTKPDPEGYLLAAHRLGVDISECVAIEDSETGLKAARTSGAFTIHVSPEVRHTDDVRLATWQSLADKTVGDLRRLIGSPTTP